MSVVLGTFTVSVAACSSVAGHGSASDVEPVPSVTFAQVDGVTVVAPGAPRELALEAANVFETADYAIYASPANLAEANDLARTHHVPVFIAATDATERTAPSSVDDPEVAAALTRLDTDYLVTLGTVAPESFDGEVVSEIPVLDVEQGQDFLVLTEDVLGLGSYAAAGGTLIASADPYSTEAVAALAQPKNVIAISDDPQVSWKIDVVREGAELPGGGFGIFDGKRYVALYGSPLTNALGVLGEQGTEETIRRAADTAAQYTDLTEDTVIPTLAIIATVAAGSAGDDGNYSNEADVEQLRPLVQAAADAGQYVILEFQPGRSDYLTQIKMYEELLAMPHVGIALDPEWRLGPDELPLTRIGHVEIAEVNEVGQYLAAFARERRLPQKLIVLHQFQVQMLRDIDQLDQSHEQIAYLIHADGQGSQGAKAGTWATLLENAPNMEHWGWKNFYDEDVPMLDPAGTMAVEPTPYFISYQ